MREAQNIQTIVSETYKSSLLCLTCLTREWGGSQITPHSNSTKSVWMLAAACQNSLSELSPLQNMGYMERKQDIFHQIVQSVKNR